MTWVLAIVGVAAAAPLGTALVEVGPGWWALPLARPFVMGAGGGLVIGWGVRRWAPVLAILEHELTHLLVALLLLRRPLGVAAGEAGGAVVYQGRGSTLIRLAPYLLPTLTVLGLALGLAIRADLHGGYVSLLGGTWGYHLWRAAADARPHQPDLQQGGLLPSYLAIASWGPLLFAATALAAVGPPELIEGWGLRGWALARRWLGGIS